MLRRISVVRFVLVMVLSVTACSGAELEELPVGQVRVPAASDDLDGEL